MYEVQKHITLSNHSWDAFVTVANNRAWARLPDDVKQIATKHFNEAALGQRQDVAKLEAAAEEKLKANGMTIHRPPAGQFREALGKTDYYKDWRKKIGPEGWAVLDKTAGLQGLA